MAWGCLYKNLQFINILSSWKQMLVRPCQHPSGKAFVSANTLWVWKVQTLFWIRGDLQERHHVTSRPNVCCRKLLCSVWMMWRNWSLKFRSHHARWTPKWLARCWHASMEDVGGVTSPTCTRATPKTRTFSSLPWWWTKRRWQWFVMGLTDHCWFEKPWEVAIDLKVDLSSKPFGPLMKAFNIYWSITMVAWLAQKVKWHALHKSRTEEHGAILMCESRLFPWGTWDPGANCVQYSVVYKRDLQAGPLRRLRSGRCLYLKKNGDADSRSMSYASSTCILVQWD